MALHGLEGFFRFVSMRLEEEEQSLLIPELSIVLDFILVDVLMELPNLFLFVVIMLNLSVVEKSTAFLAFFSLLFLF